MADRKSDLAFAAFFGSGKSGGGGSGSVTAADLDDSFKDALLDCFENVAWATEDGQQYYDALEATLYPPAELLSISAAFEQGETVIYDTDSLDDLKPMLSVTARYTDGTSAEVTTYTLRGTLTEGTSTITVSYGGKTASFNVTVTHNEYLYDLKESDFMYGYGASNVRPYYGKSSNRAVYAGFDLLIEPGKTYEIVATSTYDTAGMAIYINKVGVSDLVENGQAITGKYIDTGWQNLSIVYTMPSGVESIRFAFRQSTANPDISDDFKITRLTIKEVTE